MSPMSSISPMNWSLALRYALRDLRGGIKGFRVFLACLALGVAAIAGVGSLADAIVDGLRREGRAILGGDMEFRLVQRPASVDELDFMKSLGTISQVVELRAMARALAGDGRTIVELKAVDRAYPMVGQVVLSDGRNLADALALVDGKFGIVAEQALVERLNLKPGDLVRLGSLDTVFRATLVGEPDRLSGGLNAGPRVMIAQAGLADTGLMQLGSLANHGYRILTPPDTSISSLRDRANAAFPQAGWRIREASESSPQIKAFVERLALFLVLVGLTALVVGGVGVSNAVKGYLDGKTRVIAILKCLGAPGATIFSIYLFQVMLIAALGIVIGLVLGASLPFLALSVLADQLPFTAHAQLSVAALAMAALYGFLTALVFTIWPLATARDVPPAALFRDLIAPRLGLPRWEYLLATFTFALGLCALAILQAEDRRLAIWFIVAAIAAFVILRLTGSGVMVLTRLIPRPRWTGLRIAIANLHRPGSQTPTIILSLGLGLTLLVAVAGIERNLSTEVRDNVSGRAPTFFFVDVQNDQFPAFRTLSESLGGKDGFSSTPSLRGRITKLNGVSSEDAQVDSDGRWALKGDRGVTYSAALPKNASIVEGKYWPIDYTGPPLISFDVDLARQLRLKIGDTMSVNVMGREITGTISNLRKIDWGTAGINFFMVFSPGIFEGAPHTHLATLRVGAGEEEKAFRQLTDAFPNVSVIRIKEAIEAINAILQRMKTALMAASLVTIVAGVLVLGGAMAAGQRRRIYEAVVLKVLGMTRAQVLFAYLVEYALLGLVAAILAVGAGNAAAFAVITQLMGGRFVFDWLGSIQIAILSVVVTVGLGLVGTLGALSAKASGQLRAS